MTAGPFRHAYASLGSVTRLAGTRLLAGGIRRVVWEDVPDMVDPLLGAAGQLRCRVTVGGVPPARSVAPPSTSGTTNKPDEGVVCFDVTDYLLADDRITFTSGPVAGVWDVRTRPEIVENGRTAAYMRASVLRVDAGTPAVDDIDVCPSSGIRHTYSTTVEVSRGGVVLTDHLDALGVAGRLRCRMAMGFFRPGKDMPTDLDAGRTRDRDGLMLCDYTDKLSAGDRLKVVAGPHSGVFEIRSTPEACIDMNRVRFMEVPYIEVSGVLP